LSVVTSDCAIGRAIFWGMGDFGGNVRSGDRAIGKWAIGRSGDRAIGQIHDSVRLILPVIRN